MPPPWDLAGAESPLPRPDPAAAVPFPAPSMPQPLWPRRNCHHNLAVDAASPNLDGIEIPSRPRVDPACFPRSAAASPKARLRVSHILSSRVALAGDREGEPWLSAPSPFLRPPSPPSSARAAGRSPGGVGGGGLPIPFARILGLARDSLVAQRRHAPVGPEVRCASRRRRHEAGSRSDGAQQWGA
ncbi:hypothetical protein ZWY2020_012176 [Hordeum vulgare]|nr:hypothetical protein ZWY2020_012176 [Hordeum vulgare]